MTGSVIELWPGFGVGGANDYKSVTPCAMLGLFTHKCLSTFMVFCNAMSIVLQASSILSLFAIIRFPSDCLNKGLKSEVRSCIVQGNYAKYLKSEVRS